MTTTRSSRPIAAETRMAGEKNEWVSQRTARLVKHLVWCDRIRFDDKRLTLFSLIDKPAVSL
ncbi:hypothetical protein SCFA_110018 [anaerobic digester metagenome]|uniref:Uncharacterized protein n=1 Tax=anaerobic digester metagenome TaxID=1263854 RepID=A0A485LUC5_9ZZZZ